MMRTSGKENFEAKSIMIVGGSRIGKHVALYMQKSSEVKLIDSSIERCEALAEILENTLIINGDCRNAELLLREGITKMDCFIAVTGNSETNILSCLLAKRMGVKKTIAEVENMEYINLAENIGIDTIINKKISAASRIFRHTTNPNVTQVKYLTGADAEVIEFNVPANAKITKGTLRSMDFPEDAIVGGGTRDGEPFIATGDTIIKVNDKVVVEYKLVSGGDNIVVPEAATLMVVNRTLEQLTRYKDPRLAEVYRQQFLIEYNEYKRLYEDFDLDELINEIRSSARGAAKF